MGLGRADRIALALNGPKVSVVEVGTFAVGPKDCDEFDWPVDRAEPVGCEGAELNCFAWLDDQILFAKNQTHPPVEDVHPVMPVMDA